MAHTDGRTDRCTTYDSNTVLAVRASHGKKLTKRDDVKRFVATVLFSAAEVFPVADDAIRPWRDTVTSIGVDLVICSPAADCFPAAAGPAEAAEFRPSLRLARSFTRMSDAASLCTCNFFFSIRWRASANLVFWSSFCLASKILPEFWPESFRRASNLLNVGFSGCCIAAANNLEDPLYEFLDPAGACPLCPNRLCTLHKQQTFLNITRCGAQHSIRAALCGTSVTWVDMVAPPDGWEIVLWNSRFSVGLNYGPIFRRLWTKVNQITSADTEEIVICNSVFWLSISCCSVPEIFSTGVWSRLKLRRKKHVFQPQFFGGRTPNFWT